jgi:C4-dicarboxylate-specific signal transduction histidine kinase
MKELDQELPAVCGSRIHLQQVLLNLISNGFDAMTEKGVERRTLVIRSQMHDSSTVRVELQDSGAGFEEDNTESLFEPFFTTKSAGMGMGLPINKKIIEAFGGRISLENMSGGGVVASFTLPIAKNK